MGIRGILNLVLRIDSVCGDRQSAHLQTLTVTTRGWDLLVAARLHLKTSLSLLQLAGAGRKSCFPKAD